MKDALRLDSCRNLWIYAHGFYAGQGGWKEVSFGQPSGICDYRAAMTGVTGLSASDISQILLAGNKKSLFRFAFMDGCETSRWKTLCKAFGIPTRPVDLDYFQNPDGTWKPGERPRAFLGWKKRYKLGDSSLYGPCLGLDFSGELAVFRQTFVTEWVDHGQKLDDAVNAAIGERMAYYNTLTPRGRDPMKFKSISIRGYKGLKFNEYNNQNLP